MKKIILALVLLLGIMCTTGAQTIRSASNSTLATVESNGTVRDYRNFMIAKICNNGDIRDVDNRLLFRTESDGVIRDQYNSVHGENRGRRNR